MESIACMPGENCTARILKGLLVLQSGLPKVIFLAVAEAECAGGKTSALKVEAEGEAKGEAEGEAEGLVFCI